MLLPDKLFNLAKNAKQKDKRTWERIVGRNSDSGVKRDFELANGLLLVPFI
jgi:hypothetical protein